MNIDEAIMEFMRDPKQLNKYKENQQTNLLNNNYNNVTINTNINYQPQPIPPPVVAPRFEGMMMQSAGFLRSARSPKGTFVLVL